MSAALFRRACGRFWVWVLLVEISDFLENAIDVKPKFKPNLNLKDSKTKGAWRNGSARSSYCCKAVRLRLRVRVPWCS